MRLAFQILQQMPNLFLAGTDVDQEKFGVCLTEFGNIVIQSKTYKSKIMSVENLTKKDLYQFKAELLTEIHKIIRP